MKYTHNYMKIFLDTADTEIINEHFKTGLIDGVTTNPTLIMKSGRNPEDVYQEIKDIGVKDISMEVMGTEGEMYCLLYTSPSPRDRSLSRMPSSA